MVGNLYFFEDLEGDTAVQAVVDLKIGEGREGGGRGKGEGGESSHRTFGSEGREQNS